MDTLLLVTFLLSAISAVCGITLLVWRVMQCCNKDEEYHRLALHQSNRKILDGIKEQKTLITQSRVPVDNITHASSTGLINASSTSDVVKGTIVTTPKDTSPTTMEEGKVSTGSVPKEQPSSKPKPTKTKPSKQVSPDNKIPLIDAPTVKKGYPVKKPEIYKTNITWDD